MTNDQQRKADPLDQLIREAAAFTTDEDRLAANVNRRIRQNALAAHWPWARLLPALAPGMARGLAPGLGFALILVVTPLAVARIPLGGADPALGLLSAFALGDPGMLGVAPRSAGGL